MNIPKSLLVVAILNTLIRLYGGVGSLDVIEIVLIAAAIYFVLQGQKRNANICGILVPAIYVLGNVGGLLYIADWHVTALIVFFAILILSVLFTIVTLKAKPQQKATSAQTTPEKAVEAEQKQNSVES